MNKPNIAVSRLTWKPLEDQDVEFVERKGLGHPDYIADAISEASSIALSREYLKRYGIIMHHNVDKVLVVGGQSRPEFGGGEVIRPIYIIIAGRATTEIKRGSTVESFPIGPILLKSAKKWLKENFRFLDIEKDVIIDFKIGKGSADLVDIFEREKKYPAANDTSIGVSFAPLTETEKIVLETERYLNSRDFKKILPAVGEDIKVMGLRRGDKIYLTIAAAIISSFVNDFDEYVNIKEELKERVCSFIEKYTDKEVEVFINTGDDLKKRSINGLYLVVTGTSAEHGDDGATGRGNRVNGLITPQRPMSLEAAAGKNPINHVGKLYNIIASKIANRIASMEGVEEVYVKILSQIGRPINDPLIAHVSVICDEKIFNTVKYESESIISEELNNINLVREEILNGKITLF